MVSRLVHLKKFKIRNLEEVLTGRTDRKHGGKAQYETTTEFDTIINAEFDTIINAELTHV